MEINNNNQIQRIIQDYTREVDAAAARKDARRNEQGKAVDTVEISTDNRRDVENAKRAIAELPEKRNAEVKEIKTRIASGEYNPEAKDVAERIVSHYIIDTLV